MAPHSSTLAWQIPWMEEPGGLQSMGSRRVGHDWATYFHFSLSCIGKGNGNPLQCSCLENPRDKGAWWAAVYGVTQSRTRLKRLSSSKSWEVMTRFSRKEITSDLWRGSFTGNDWSKIRSPLAEQKVMLGSEPAEEMRGFHFLFALLTGLGQGQE